MKTCTGPCGRALASEAYSRRKRALDGRASRCKECEAERNRAYHAEHRDQVLSRQSSWRDENADQVKAYKAGYREENREAIAAYSAQYKTQHREQIRARRKTSDAAYYAANREQAMRRATRWNAEHPEERRIMARAGSAVRYALKTGRLARPDACEACSAVGPVEGAHSDYSKPLEVRWLCTPCHRQWDKQDPKLFSRHGDQRHIRRAPAQQLALLGEEAS